MSVIDVFSLIEDSITQHTLHLISTRFFPFCGRVGGNGILVAKGKGTWTGTSASALGGRPWDTSGTPGRELVCL